MKLNKMLAMCFVVLFTLNTFSISANAAGSPVVTDAVDSATTAYKNGTSLSNQSNGISTMSYNSSFTLDFSKSSAWTLDFDNNSTLMFNHKKVTVKYISNIPSNTSATVRIVLYIDEEKDGTYVQYDPSGGYSYTLKHGDSLEIKLPYGNTVKNYRLLFVNQTSSVTSGEFSVKTSS